MPKWIKRALIFLSIGYALVCTFMYFFQEKFLFHPTVLDKNHTYHFDIPFRELDFKMNDGIHLNALLFPADDSKGLIFHLHGNAGSIDSWGNNASIYTDLGYDILMVDYRGFGKSEGTIQSEAQLISDIETVYTKMLELYSEDSVRIIGYSIGTGIAVQVAAKNHPKQLILEAPYYSMVDMMRLNYPIIPTFLLNYRLETNKHIQQCESPIVIFHGIADQVIPYGSSVQLKKLLDKDDRLILLKNQRHQGIPHNPEYVLELKKELISLP